MYVILKKLELVWSQTLMQFQEKTIIFFDFLSNTYQIQFLSCENTFHCLVFYASRFYLDSFPMDLQVTYRHFILFIPEIILFLFLLWSLIQVSNPKRDFRFSKKINIITNQIIKQISFVFALVFFLILFRLTELITLSGYSTLKILWTESTYNNYWITNEIAWKKLNVNSHFNLSSNIFGMSNNSFNAFLSNFNINEGINIYIENPQFSYKFDTFFIFYDKIAIDFYTDSAKLFIIFSAGLILRLSHNFLEEISKTETILEFPLLIGFATLLLLMLVSTMDLIVLGLVMEGLSLILYVLISFNYNWEFGLEASIKYFSLGGIMSALSWLGIGLIYGSTDLTQFMWLSIFINTLAYENHILINLGLICILFSFLFKLSAFPCHIWAPEVYSGSHLLINAFLMLPTKMGIFILFTRLLYYAFWPLHSIWQIYLTTAAIGSLLIGAFLALNEKTLQRFIASSSINQIGILLLGLSCATWGGVQKTLFYLWIYMLTMLLFFWVLLYLTNKNFELQELSNFNIISNQQGIPAFLGR